MNTAHDKASATVPSNQNVKSRNNTRKYLDEAEIERLLKSARQGRHGLRDYAMLLMMYRHGLRVSELVNIRVTDISLDTAQFRITRSKGSVSNTQPLYPDELRALRAYLRHRKSPTNPYLFLSERKTPMERFNMNYLVRTIGERAGLSVPVHPHMLRHSTGYSLINKGIDIRTVQGLLGHKSIQNTVRYTELSPKRFEFVWS